MCSWEVLQLPRFIVYITYAHGQAAEHACSTCLTTHKCLQCLQCTVDLNCSRLREGEELHVKLVQLSLRVALGFPGDGDS